MPSLSARLQLAASIGLRPGVAALSAALGAAGPEERAAVAQALVALARPVAGDPAMRALADHWAALDETLRRRVLGVFVEAGPAALQRLLTEGDADDQRLAALLGVTWVQARSAGWSGEWGPHDAAMFAAADAALAVAAEEYPGHRVPGLIEAILRLSPRPGPVLREWLTDDRQAGHLALRAAVRAMPEPEFLRAATGLARHATLARVVIERLARLPGPARGEALARAHLLRTRERAGLSPGRAAEIDELLGPREAVASWPEEARCAAAAWLARAREPGALAAATARLADRLADPSARVRLAAARALAAMPAARERDELLRDFAFDPDDGVAWSAACALAAARSPARRAALAPVMARLRRSPHARVRAAASAWRRSNDPWANETVEGGMSRWACPVASRLALALDLAAFDDELRRRVREGSVEQRIGAMGLAERLSRAEVIEPELIELARGADERLAGKAVKLLGRVPGEAAARVVRDSLHAALARARADAVEAVPPGAATERALFELLGDESPRVRANAVRRVLRARPYNQRASRALLDMLADARAGHRASGLWAAERLARRGLPLMEALAGRVNDLARAERDGAVAERAARCARRLLIEMRMGWSRGPIAGTLAGDGSAVRWGGDPATAILETRGQRAGEVAA